MNIRIVDLYQTHSTHRPENVDASLECYLFRTSDKVSRNRKKPAVLIVPGGGYDHVSPREGMPVVLKFAAAGYVPFVLRYSCAPNGFPVALREAAMAMAYIRENAADFEVDPRMVAAVGFSAGGHLCITLGTMYDSPELADLGPSSLFRPDALGLCYPVAVSWGRTHEGTFCNISGGDDTLRGKLSAERLVRPDMPPVFLWHTRDDVSVPCRNALVMAQALEENGVDFSLHIYRQGPHGLSTADLLAYPAGSLPQISRDVSGWIGSMIAFFEDIGFKITDTEEEKL